MFNFFSLNDTTDYKYLIKQIGKEVKVNCHSKEDKGYPMNGDNGDKPALKAIITNTKGNLSYKDDKNITTLFEIKQGDFIEYNQLYWLILFPVNKKRYGKYKGIMRAISHIVCMNIDDKITGIPVISYGASFGISTNNYMNISKDEIVLTTQDNEITENIEVNDTFIIWNNKYIVEGIDHTEPGLLHLHCAKTQKAEHEEEYFINTPWKELTESEPPEEPEEPEDTITYSLVGEDTVYLGMEETYTATRFVNDVADESAIFNFSIDYMDNPSSIAKLTTISNNKCKIECEDNPYTIKLIAEDDNSKETIEKQIDLRSLF